MLILNSMIAYTIFNVNYGHRPASENEPLLLMIRRMMMDFRWFAAPGYFMVDNLPFCAFTTHSPEISKLMRHSEIPPILVPGRRFQTVRKRSSRAQSSRV